MKDLIKKVIKEALKDAYISDYSYHVLVTQDEEFMLIRPSSTKPTTIPTLVRTEYLDINDMSRCSLVNSGMVDRARRVFNRASTVFIKDRINSVSRTTPNNFTLKVLEVKDGSFIQRDDINFETVFD